MASASSVTTTGPRLDGFSASAQVIDSTHSAGSIRVAHFIRLLLPRNSYDLEGSFIGCGSPRRRSRTRLCSKPWITPAMTTETPLPTHADTARAGTPRGWRLGIAAGIV